uniref:Cytochrome P450 n=1 Tax=Oryza meridionalis TaxID=40149 RepID=A0A0E0D2M9_9ORYZ
MDELSAGSLYLVILGTLALALAFKRVLRGKETGVKLPPGPWNLPIIGSFHHLVGAHLPHRALLRTSRRHGPLMLLRLGARGGRLFPEAAMEFLWTCDPVFTSRPRGATLNIVSFGGKGIVMAPYGEHWRQVCKVCVVELLSTRQVQRLDSIRQEEVSRLVEAIATTSPATASIGMTQTLAALNNDIIARAVFGGSAEDDDNDDLLDVLLRLQREDNLTFPITAEIIGALISVSGNLFQSPDACYFLK